MSAGLRTRVAEIGPDRAVHVVERELAEPGPGEVRVRVVWCGVCGSDLHMRADPAIPPGSVLGHEIAGQVAAVGPGVTRWRPGERVAVLPYRSCGECAYCRAGIENLCANGGHLGEVIGVQRPGGLADHVTADEQNLLPLGTATYRQGALAEPVAVGVRAAATANPAASDRVQIIGAGPIGIVTAHVLRARGSEPVLVELSAERRAVAEGLGLRVVDGDPDGRAAADTLGGRPDVVIDCAGTSRSVEAAVNQVRPQGRVVVVGLGATALSVPSDAFVLREITLRGCAGYSKGDFAAALDLLRAGAIPDGLVTGTVDLADAGAMFTELATGATAHVKVLVGTGADDRTHPPSTPTRPREVVP